MTTITVSVNDQGPSFISILHKMALYHSYTQGVHFAPRQCHPSLSSLQSQQTRKSGALLRTPFLKYCYKGQIGKETRDSGLEPNKLKSYPRDSTLLGLFTVQVIENKSILLSPPKSKQNFKLRHESWTTVSIRIRTCDHILTKQSRYIMT